MHYSLLTGLYFREHGKFSCSIIVIYGVKLYFIKYLVWCLTKLPVVSSWLWLSQCEYHSYRHSLSIILYIGSQKQLPTTNIKYHKPITKYFIKCSTAVKCSCQRNMGLWAIYNIIYNQWYYLVSKCLLVYLNHTPLFTPY